MNCPRMRTFFLLFFFYTWFYVEPVRRFAAHAGSSVSPWLQPFLLSSLYYGLVFLVGAIYLFSKVPFMERRQMYLCLRLGRTKWILLHLCKVLACSILYTVAVFLCIGLALFPYVRPNLGWGKVLYTLSLTNASTEYELEFSISYQLLAKFEAPMLVGLTFLISACIVLFLGLIMFLISLYFSRLCAVVCASIFAVCPILIENISERNIQQVLVNCIPTEWLVLDKLGLQNLRGVLSPDFPDVMIRLVCITALLTFCILFMSRKMEFHWYGEE